MEVQPPSKAACGINLATMAVTREKNYGANFGPAPNRPSASLVSWDGSCLVVKRLFLFLYPKALRENMLTITSYLEGIDILLRTNTFHMSSNVLFTNLNRLLLPHRIATITSLELRWSLLPRVKGYDDFHALLSMTKTNFPRLQKLHISIEGELRHLSRSADSLAQVENLILKPIEQMIVGLPKLEMLEVALPLSLYDLKRFKVRGSYVEPGYGVHDDERLWTALQPSSSGESTDGVLSGYWVCNPQLLKEQY